MTETLAADATPAEDRRVLFAETIAGLVEEAQKQNPSLTIEDIADKAGVHRVTLTNILSAAKKGRVRMLDEDLFLAICRVLGRDAGAVLSDDLRAVRDRWLREQGR